MDLFVNELSLHGQFLSLELFLTALKEVIGCRNLADRYGHPFYCVRTLTDRDALPTMSFRDAIRQNRDINLTRLVTSWLDKHGPFWDDMRAHSSDDYFEYGTDVVTDCGLGEAAFRAATERATTMVSFGSSAFCTTPLRVVWRHSGDADYELELSNVWTRVNLESHLHEYEAAPQSWTELLERAKVRYRRLTFADNLLEPLTGEPFNTTIADRVLALLNVLDQLKGCYDANATLTAEGHLLLQKYFHGDRALFSDESDTNKRSFARQLTFHTPTGEAIFCPYHGKISFRFYRVHHSWPIRPDEPLYIAYIGPKITRG